ncbi:MAG: molybdopterin-guanine dinucleotide biosynthesis protein B [Deltaproteobacteria bacterium]|nr:molybdopterin-guanine dinucleotide biosynthesis protein B [Deltaproteobacteria bacterium]
MHADRHPPIVSIVGKSDAGKTTFIEKLLPRLVARGLKVATVKHDVHGFSMDHEGKDSFRHKQAGASVSMVSSPTSIGMVRNADHDHSLEELATRFLSDMDLVITEGYKREGWPKIEVHRQAMRTGLLATPQEGLLAVATDEPLDVAVPQFDLDDAEGVADLIVRTLLP